MKSTKDYVFSQNVTSVHDFVSRVAYHKVPISFFEVREPSGTLKYYELTLELKLEKYHVLNLSDCLKIAIDHPDILFKLIQYDEIIEVDDSPAQNVSDVAKP